MYRSVRGDLIKLPIESDHFAIKMVDSADAEVPVHGNLVKGGGPVVDALHEGINGGELRQRQDTFSHRNKCGS